MLRPPSPTSTLAPSVEPALDFRPMSSSLYGSSASSSRAASSLISRRSKRWPSLTIFFMRDSMACRSSGLNGSATSKS
jgi:hypothetical protein